jgi:hypothetical protein
MAPLRDPVLPVLAWVNGAIEEVRRLCLEITDQTGGVVECLAVVDTAPLGGVKEVISTVS